MADPFAMIQWKELEHLVRERYPDLPFPEAYLRLHEDVLIEFPKEFAEVIKLYLPQLVD
jgi:disulfide oxidoreductase YuzD